MTPTAAPSSAPSRLRAAFDWTVLLGGVLSLGIAVIGTLISAEQSYAEVQIESASEAL